MSDPPSDSPIDTQAEIRAAQERLPLDMSDTKLPLDIQIRSIALMIAQRHTSDNTVKEGALYDALRRDGKNLQMISLDDVVRAALVFERYLWGEWSKGIAERALAAVSEQAAEAIEKELEKVNDEKMQGVQPEDHE